MSESRTKKLARFFSASLRANPPVKLNVDEYKALCELIDNPPKPNPALILAMERARERRLQDKLPK